MNEISKSAYCYLCGWSKGRRKYGLSSLLQLDAFFLVGTIGSHIVQRREDCSLIVEEVEASTQYSLLKRRQGDRPFRR